MARSGALLRLTSRLIARRDALRRFLSEEVGRLRERSEVVGHGDHADAAVASAHDEICSCVAELESRELAEIEQALLRIAEGKYGRCDSCGGRIPPIRLNVLPCTTRCIACQRRDERRTRSEPQFPGAEPCSNLDERPELHGNGDRMPGYEDFSVRIECTS